MSYEYSGLFSVVLSSTLVNKADLADIVDALGDSGYRYNQGLLDGTGSGKAQAHWHDRRTLAESASEDLDLSALPGPHGTVSFTKLKVIIVRVATETAGAEISVGPASATPFAEVSAALGPNGILPVGNPVDGWAVTANTNDLLKVANTGTGSVTYDIVLIGEGSVT